MMKKKNCITKKIHEVLTRFSRIKAKKHDQFINHVLFNPVNVNGNSTSVYLINSGLNMGIVLKYLKVKHQNKSSKINSLIWITGR